METLRGFPCLPANGAPPAKLAGSPRDLNESKSRLPPDAEADKRLAEVDALRTSLQTSPGTVHTSKGQTLADTVQIDLYDGTLYASRRDLKNTLFGYRQETPPSAPPNRDGGVAEPPKAH